jgi:hypothetical protein
VLWQHFVLEPCKCPKDAANYRFPVNKSSRGLVTSIIRFIIFYSIDGQTDGSWVATRLGSVSIAETGVYVLGACLPIYRSLYRSIKSRGGTTFGSRSGFASERRDGTSVKLKSLHKSQKGFEYSDEQLVSPNGQIRVKRDVRITTSQHS